MFAPEETFRAKEFPSCTAAVTQGQFYSYGPIACPFRDFRKEATMRRGSKNFIVQPSEFCWERCGTNQAKFGRLFSFVPWGGRCSTSFPAKFARLDDEIAGSANWLVWGISLDREELMIPRGWNLTVHLKLKFRSTSRSLKNPPRFPGCPDENHENNARKDCWRLL